MFLARKTAESGSGKFVFDEKRIIVDHIDMHAKHTKFIKVISRYPKECSELD